MDIMETFDDGLGMDIDCLICDEVMHVTYIPHHPLPMICPKCKEAVMKVRNDIEWYRKNPYVENDYDSWD